MAKPKLSMQETSQFLFYISLPRKVAKSEELSCMLACPGFLSGAKVEYKPEARFIAGPDVCRLLGKCMQPQSRSTVWV